MGYFRLGKAICRVEVPDTNVALRRLFERRAPGGRALALATGPSARELDARDVDAQVRIVCNSAVRDVDLIRALQPNIICFADPVFHFGPSKYAAAFRSDLANALTLTDALVVVTSRYVGPMIAAMPELRDRLVVLDDTAPTWRWPDECNADVKQTGNILTQLMLPVAFALADAVDIAGCDGRVASENYFWKHNKATQYSDELMRDAFAAHPAFFSTRDYGQYYERHVRSLTELLEVAEAAGKKIRGVTSSHIPALVARGAPALS
jgi:hypothetical protein